jgi:hypothetical protein
MKTPFAVHEAADVARLRKRTSGKRALSFTAMDMLDVYFIHCDGALDNIPDALHCREQFNGTEAVQG